MRNAEAKTPQDVADASTRPVLTGDHRKEELLEAARSGCEDKILQLLTPLNVNCHASDGRKSTPLHLAAGYNRTRIVQLLLQHGADVHAKAIISARSGKRNEKNCGRFCWSPVEH